MADILVGPTARFLGARRQQGLSTVQRLNPRLFVDTQYQCIFRGIQIEGDNIQQLGFKIGIWTERQGTNSMGLQVGGHQDLVQGAARQL